MAPSAEETNFLPQDQQTKLHILVAAVPIFGHLENMRAIASFLVSQSYKVSFLCATCFRSRIESLGATFVPLEGEADFDWDRRDELWPDLGTLLRSLSPLEKVSANFSTFFLKHMVSQYWTLQKFLANAYAAHPNEDVVMLHDICFMGALPPLLGAPGLKPAGLISMGITPLLITSIDTGPFGLALPPDSTEAGRKRNAALNADFQRKEFAPCQAGLAASLQELGAATDSVPFVLDILYTKPDLFLQLSIPELEYPRSDFPKNIRFIGALPPGLREKSTSYPPWWDEIISPDRKQKLVVVTQGTASNEPSELIIPTLTALASHEDDILVVTTLVRTSTLPPGTYGSNSRIAQFIPYDSLFPFADVVVSNGGYGTVQQALINGVPLVLAGESEDKTEACARVEWAGAAVNLRTQTPSVDAVREAVLNVLGYGEEQSGGGSRWAIRARELSAVYARYHCLANITCAVDELVLRKRENETEKLI